MVIRPSLKPVIAAYVIAIILAAAGALWWNWTFADKPAWPSALFALLLIWPLRRHMRRQMTKVTIAGGKLRYQYGLLSKTTRLIELAKVQDVRSEQKLGQRLLGIGDLTIETAGESSRLTVQGIDRPQETAEQILNAAHQKEKATEA
jgi:uncharacterized membrane protein YdbT with pleckstrin-like domain